MRPIAFVASTLPFQLIAHHHDTLGISLVVCGSDALTVSYKKGFSRLGLDIKVVSASRGSWLTTNIKLLSIVLRTREALVFHECCWRNLDIFLLLFRIRTHYIPTVTLESRKKVPARNVNNKRLFAILTSWWFDYYETPNDGGGDDVYYVPALKEKFRAPISIPTKSPSQNVADKKVNNGRTVLILCSTDVVPTDILHSVYQEIIFALLESGLKVHVKDHPNPESRLGEFTGACKKIDSDLPLECLDLSDYVAFVSIASTALSVGKTHGEIISIIRLLPAEFQDKLSDRLKHLSSMDIFPAMPSSIDMLVQAVLVK